MRRRANPDTDRELANRLHSAAIHLLRRVRRTDPLTGVSPAQLSALSVLMSGPKTLGELAAAEQVRPPTMSRLVGEMRRAGVARTRADRRDRRLVRVLATSRGLRVLRRGRRLRIENLEQLLASLDEGERASLGRALGAIERMLRYRETGGAARASERHKATK